VSWTDLSAGIMWSGAALAIWAALSASRNAGIPGRRSFILMQLSIALWSGTAGIELLTHAPATHAWIARIQYLGITSLPVLWLSFAGRYAHRLNARDRWLGILWLIPVITVLAAFTNNWHHWLWRDVIMPGPGEVLPRYVRGPVFWVNWIYAYVLLAVGTMWLALTLRHYSARYRIQLWLLILGVLAPWVGNLMYILGLVPLPGLDMTPLAFSISGACFVASVFAAKR
jgi:hypothetical protein